MAALSSCARISATTPDPIQLHGQAMNSLSRCSRELRSASPSYALAEQHLAAAQDALRVLAAIDAGSLH